MTKPGEGDQGLIFNIQRFSIHDGPGIRTTVFMKGCPLRCTWCSNPESQDFSPNLIVRNIHCKGCGACVKTCPEKAIALSKTEGRIIDWSKCDQCLLCVASCAYHSLSVCGSYMGVQDVLDEVVRDECFYRNSGGGLTVSGGEALAQSEFVANLFAACKREGLHTALDTSGYASWERARRVLTFVDLVLFDIKHLDPLEHKKVTGVDNRGILENLTRIAKEKPVWLRMPLIAGFNDSEAYVRRVISLAKKIHAEKISLLPYHEGGKSKSEQLGRVYPCPDAKAPDGEHIDTLKRIAEKEKMKVSIGN
jgi:pyruvate formate lyase activating enzyme